MKKKYVLFLGFLFFHINIFAQNLNHIKQCFVTADIVDSETQKILDTKAYHEVCVKFITEKNARIWISNHEFILTFLTNELLETDENGNLIYKGTGLIGEIKFEIVYLVAPDYTYFVALVLLRNSPVLGYEKKMILQYKKRS